MTSLSLTSFLLQFIVLQPRLLNGSKRWESTLGQLAATSLDPFLNIVPFFSIPLAMAIAYSRFVENTIYPVIVFLQIIPKIAIAPLFIIWLGFGLLPKLLIVFLLCFFPIVVSSVAGFKSVDPDVMDFARSTGASPTRMFFKIRLPQALPEIFTGLKIGAALSATAAVVAEFVASDRGLSYLLQQYNGQLETPMVFAIIVLLSLIGLAIYYAVELIERLVIPWHVAQRPTEIAGI